MKRTIKSLYPVFTALALALTCFAFSPAAQAAPPEPAKPDEATRARVSETYGKLPLSFEANEGQQERQVKFLSRGSGYNLFLTNQEAVLVLTKLERPAPPANKAPLSQKKPKRQSAVLRTKLVGANPAAEVTGEEELPGKVNYFIGNDRSKWRTDVATYAKVHYEQVYPGIDLVYYGNQRQLEYDFVVAPGADPARIRLRVAGARKMYVNGQGQLVMKTAGGAVRWDKPEIYQEVDGRHQSVKGKYVLRRGHELSFQVAAYDAARPLIIDPVLSYSTYLGGPSKDYGYGIAVDISFAAYVTGKTLGVNFPPGSFHSTLPGQSDAPTPDPLITPSTAFVTRVNGNGTSFIWSTLLGGPENSVTTSGQGIAVDRVGRTDPYVTGYTTAPDFPTTTNCFQPGYGGLGYSDAFVTKLDSVDGHIMYSTYLGGFGNDVGTAIAVDSAGDAYVTGYTDSSNFPHTSGAYQITHGPTTYGPYDAFVFKLHPAGMGTADGVYSTYLGLDDDDYGNGIAVDNDGNAYVTGSTLGDPFLGIGVFPTTAGAYHTTYGGGSSDAFVIKLNPPGTDLVYSTYLGDVGDDYGTAISVLAPLVGCPGCQSATSSDDYGNGIAEGADPSTSQGVNAYVTGYTTGPFDTLPGAYQPTFGGGSYDAFVIKLNPAGTGLVYSTYLGGTGDDYGQGIAVGSTATGSGTLYVTNVTGYTNSTTRFPIKNAFQPTFGGGGNLGDGYDAFVTRLNPAGNGAMDLLYSTYLGGSNDDRGYGIALDIANSAYVTGSTFSNNFPMTPGAAQMTNQGDSDAFVSKIGNGCVLPPGIPGSNDLTMVAWYPFDENCCATAFDITHYENNGTLSGGVTHNFLGEVRTAVNFDGLTGYVAAPHASQINFGFGDFSIDAWIKVAPNATGVRMIVDKRMVTSLPMVYQGYAFYVWQANRLGVQLADGGAPPGYTNWNTTFLNPPLTDGQWHHVAVTVNRTNNPAIKFYHNGAFVVSFNPQSRLGSLDTTSDLLIGTTVEYSNFLYWFNGGMDELEMFQGVLTSDQVAAIYAAGPSGKCK